MKKTISQSLSVLLLLCLTACGQAQTNPPVNQGNASKSTSSVSAVLEQEAKKAEQPSPSSNPSTSSEPAPEPAPESASNPSAKPNNRIKSDGSYDKIDLDLSQFSETLVFAELTNMMIMPEDYEGKVVKIKGQFSHYTHPKTKEVCYLVFLMDPTACCGQALDFVLSDRNAHPENEIEQDGEITVTGLFEIYEENPDFGIASYRLVDAQLS